MTVSRPCYFGNLLLGVVGVDVNLAYILEDVTYYQDSLASYTFLIDDKGRTQGHMRTCQGTTTHTLNKHTHTPQSCHQHQRGVKWQLVMVLLLLVPFSSQYHLQLKSLGRLWNSLLVIRL